MARLGIPVGISDFEKIRKNGYYYVDKSGLIAELLEEKSTEVTLITRPRRFGKTLGMSMLANFFDIRKESTELFKGLEITEQRDVCSEWMYQFPTLFVTFKDVDGLDFSSAYGMLSSTITELYKEHLYLMESSRISPYDKEIMQRIITEEATVTDIKKSLSLLIKLMQQHYQKNVILLIDEYDVPIAKASSHQYYPQMLEILKVMMSTALKDNPGLCFAVVTGCLQIAKESIFTGTNNLVSDTISDSNLNEYFGFTQKDVDKILSEADVEEFGDEMKKWYDGYHFGEVDVYCPWDVMNYIRDIQRNPKARPASYWKNTSDNEIIRSFIDYAGSNITKKMEALLSGGYIIQRIDENLTYDYLHSSEENLWSILYLTGYLTQARENEITDPLPDNMSALKIPNAEIREIFETTVVKWFSESVKTWNRKALFDAAWSGQSEILTQEMSKLLRKTISYHDYREDFYHAFLAGIFTGAGYVVESNKEHGEGRSDIVVYDSVNGQVAIFEAKYSRTLSAMEGDCEAALCQIDRRMYAKEYEDEYDHIYCYGVAFYKRRCLVKQKKEN